ncbi:MAG: DUF1571 domain-containing protein [Planctomycetes bacterium]|nr:DUF1571 domain-containing protein [Planctomycetota bacterium]
MKFLTCRWNRLHPDQKANSAAVAIAIAAVTFLQLETPPLPAGTDSSRLAIARKTPVLVIEKKLEVPVAEKELTPEQVAERTLSRKIALLKKGIEFLENARDYTAQFSKREVVHGQLLDEQNTEMKLAHKPFNVYLKWIDFDEGREVIFKEGENDGRMTVHAGGWKSRLGTMNMMPDDALAMRDSRYPITQAGLLNLCNMVLNYNETDLKNKTYSRCEQLQDQKIGERDCHCFVMEYRSQEQSKQYRKSIMMIDNEWSVPLFIKNFEWPTDAVTATGEELDEATLVEQYTYTDVKFRSNLTAMDFDQTNEDYNFVRR